MVNYLGTLLSDWSFLGKKAGMEGFPWSCIGLRVFFLTMMYSFCIFATPKSKEGLRILKKSLILSLKPIRKKLNLCLLDSP